MATFNATKIAEAVLARLGPFAADAAEESLSADQTIREELAAVIRAAAGDCLAHCQDDEPIFVLCARDLIAPQHVRAWAAKVESFAAPDVNKVRDAQACAAEMERWPGPKKLPGTTNATKEFSNRE